MAYIVFDIDQSTAKIIVRQPDGNDMLVINPNPDRIYWVRVDGGVLTGVNADGLAHILLFKVTRYGPTATDLSAKRRSVCPSYLVPDVGMKQTSSMRIAIDH